MLVLKTSTGIFIYCCCQMSFFFADKKRFTGYLQRFSYSARCQLELKEIVQNEQNPMDIQNSDRK